MLCEFNPQQRYVNTLVLWKWLSSPLKSSLKSSLTAPLRLCLISAQGAEGVAKPQLAAEGVQTPQAPGSPIQAPAVGLDRAFSGVAGINMDEAFAVGEEGAALNTEPEK